MRRLLDGAAEQEIALRTLGGLAIFLHAPTNLAEWADQLWTNVEEAPNSPKWKLRDRVGDRTAQESHLPTYRP